MMHIVDCRKKKKMRNRSNIQLGGKQIVYYRIQDYFFFFGIFISQLRIFAIINVDLDSTIQKQESSHSNIFQEKMFILFVCKRGEFLILILLSIFGSVWGRKKKKKVILYRYIFVNIIFISFQILESYFIRIDVVFISFQTLERFQTFFPEEIFIFKPYNFVIEKYIFLPPFFQLAFSFSKV
eukprot:TRINITY_DN3663_c3_g1_i6.p2 TRINITY_DN3663_c3_g1~~TRINITY_DN3663_c3_g1_i6.p2  ORF type:complete len:182 (+),score=0.46 TRINITY_DN3663_c3_g1_i6:277-822(+)